MTSPTASVHDESASHTRPFRFKSKARRASRSRSRSPSHSHRHRRHDHRSKRRRRLPNSYNDPFAPSTLDPETAFRESLFDAMADDEGALFWEGVYGQPIHTYPRPGSKHYQDTAADNRQDMDNLHTMTDEEYVTYVRAKMWEKSHQHIIEERKKRDEDRSRRKKLDEESRRLEKGVEEALRRGEERRRKAKWKGRWEDYLQGWERFTQQVAVDAKNPQVEATTKPIPWPVLSGLEQDVSQDEVERFFRHVPFSAGDESALLKVERVRWHPDKVQQRAGTEIIDKETMRTVTAVFQIIDRMWTRSHI